MSRDSSATYIHLKSSRLADLFEEFCRPPSATFPPPSNAQNANTQQNGAGGGSGGDGSGMTQLPGHFLPFEEIQLPPHLMPINPEDEDDVVPDMHAAFGINRALGQNQTNQTRNAGEPGGEASNAGTQREPVWRDLGLESLVANVKPNGGGERPGARREGKRTGLLLLR
ncbi:hypothetical protein EDD37DRAFT_363326 [Exophiala viscosa]|uniref:Anaphase-promoting complex subunit 13 n=1 Tax=Exophiala viscosa TaxID=2486360 RepID=A0AAN6IAW1_9EURO|nr:hypothetical protein EDD36DRAFT_312359 [Exophiala viscosa]KAI1624812.1 hypothetical protein EDD37DRAFT_363326 [Exophiala viscosa]